MPKVVKHKQLFQRKLAGAAAEVLYRCPDDNTTTFVHTIIAANLDGAVTRSYSLFLNPNSNSVAADDVNTLFDGEQVSATAHDVHLFPDDCALILNKEGASLMAMASTANTIVLSGFGKEVIET